MIILPLLPFYATRLHASPETVGRLIASFSIAQLLSAPLWGRVSDRYGRRPALLIGLGASAIAFAVFGVADAVWLLFVSRVVQGAGGGTTGVARRTWPTRSNRKTGPALGWLSRQRRPGHSRPRDRIVRLRLRPRRAGSRGLGPVRGERGSPGAGSRSRDPRRA
jgi:hypothetical protein